MIHSTMSVTTWDIKKATLFEDLQELEGLTYADKAVEQLGALTGLVALKQLSLAFNSLSSLRGIGALQQLRSLNLSHNSLSSLSSLSELTGLTTLNAGHNAIASLAAVSALQGLVELKLHHNAVTRPSEVLHLSSLTNLQCVALCGNPVCSDHAAGGVAWRGATIGLLTRLQVLDADAVNDTERSQASAHAHSWEAAAANEAISGYASSNRDTSWQTTGTSNSISSQAEDRQRRAPLSKTSSANVVGLLASSDATFQGVADLLPDISVPTLKPRMLPNSGSGKAREAGAPLLLPVAKRKPATVVHTQHYPNGNTAVIIRSNGTATLNWPGGELAASLDIDDTTDPAHPGYRLLAMFRGGGSVAASYDGSGGFVQHPSGGLMLLYNRKDGTGTSYSSDGQITARWHTKKPGMRLQNDVEAVLDAHLAVRLVAKRGNELQLFFACQGILQQLSLVQGAILPDADSAVVPPAFMATWPPENSSTDQAAERQGADSKQRTTRQKQQTPAATPQQQPATAEDRPEVSTDEQQGMQDLLARARALMAASAAITSVPIDEV